MRKLIPVLLLAAACGPSTKPAPVNPDNGAGSGSGSGDEWSQYGGVDYGSGYYGNPCGGGYDPCGGGYDGNPCGGGYGGDYYGNPCGGGPYIPPAPVPPDISGTWLAACAATATKGEYATTTVVNTGTAWDVTVATFSDATCTKRKSALHLAGDYVIGAQASAIADGWEATFTFATRELTADDAKTAKALGKACGIKKMKAGKTVDLKDAGCVALGVQPAASCAANNDVLALDGDRLRLGVHPADGNLCAADKRPTALDTTRDLAYQFPPTGVAECDAMFEAYRPYARCAAFPQETRNTVFDSIRQAAPSLQQANTDPAAAAAAASSCKQATDAIKQGIASMTC